MNRPALAPNALYEVPQREDFSSNTDDRVIVHYPPGVLKTREQLLFQLSSSPFSESIHRPVASRRIRFANLKKSSWLYILPFRVWLSEFHDVCSLEVWLARMK